MLYDETDEHAYDFLPEWERVLFHWLNSPAHQIGYYDKAIEQKFLH